MSLQSTWDIHKVPCLPPAADRFSVSAAGDCVRRSAAGQIEFDVYVATGGTNTGTVKLQVEICSAADGSDATAVDFRYRKTGAGNDTWTDITAVVAATGVTTTANQEAIYTLIIDNRELNESLLGSTVADYDFIRVKGTEVVDDPVFGSITAILSKLKLEQKTHPTVMS